MIPVVVLAFALSLAELSAEPAGPAADFARDVRPILADHCHKCHGPKKQSGGLRLDARGPAMQGGDSGLSIVPGKLEESELLRRVASEDESERMPPPGKDNRPLSANQIEQLRRWIKDGANWPEETGRAVVHSDHWSFQPIGRPPVPAVKHSNWPRNPIDSFILARLESQGIAPSPEADRYTLIRRLFYDLLGLPPMPAEVDAFVQDRSPAAYERLVDRLLDSPFLGERWGRHWLDKARYADSDGYEKDNPRPDAWRYRDWLIEAINADMPFDRFTREQLAGDLIAGSTPMQRLATAFNRQTLTNTEGGVDQEQFRVEAVVDRVNTLGTVWLGLTVGCAQCHTHKYDPITQAEYYQFFAFFNNGDEVNVDVPISDAAEFAYAFAKAKFDAEIKQPLDELKALEEKLRPGFATWETKLRADLTNEKTSTLAFEAIEMVNVSATGGPKFARQDDGSYLVTDANPDTTAYTIVARTGSKALTGLRLETLADDRLPSRGPGRTPHGNFVLTELQVFSSDTNKFTKENRVAIQTGRADFAQNGFPPANAFDGNPKTGWAVANQLGVPHQARFTFQSPLASEKTWLRIVLQQNYGTQHTIGRFRLTGLTGVDPADQVPDDVRLALAADPARRSAEQAKQLFDFYVSQDPSGAKLYKQLADVRAKAPTPPVMSVRVLAQRTAQPRTTRLLRRGDFLQPQTEVAALTPAVLHEYSPRQPAQHADRLDLADWLMDADNPLTPRVAVNQIWTTLFGAGIVRTPNDFGTRGEQPTHPELLDWLAREYMRAGWSTKQLLRLIVTSSTYRQSSTHRPELREVDPTNLLLHRQNRFRVEGEIIRDLGLSAGGLLAVRIGGPSVFPPMPPDIAELSYANNFKWTTSAGADRYRRGMYTFIKRTATHPNLTAFDCPDANFTCVARRTSNTPLQALTTLNNDVHLESAQGMARRVLNELSGDDRDRMIGALRTCVARPPAGRELERLLALLVEAREWYRSHPEEAKKISGAVSTAPAYESAAWVAVARVLLNLDEFITRE